MNSFWESLTRKKTFSDEDGGSQFARVLTLFDLITLGVGGTMGIGIYVLAGSVAYNIAGPAVILSFVIAAIASTFAGLCYAEFAARVPKAGSAYVYSYVTIGEFAAFTIGWNMLIEYAVGASGVASGMSGYIDELIDKKIARWLRAIMPIDSYFLGKYPNIVAFFLIMLFTIFMIIGVKKSSMLNNVFTMVNMLTVLTVVISGAINSDSVNWAIKKEDIPERYKESAGEGGFMPFGWAGVIAGAAKCFYGFVGFDCVATTGEEAKRPERNIPLSIMISLIIICTAYLSAAIVLTMMWPYYLQNPIAPFPHAFEKIGWIEIKWVVTIGALFALSNSLYGSIFPNPRIVYSMAKDGLIFKYFSSVNSATHIPIRATVCCGLFAGFMALLFDLDQLIGMMSMGTLLAYTVVALSVLLLRYRDPKDTNNNLGVSYSMIIKHLINLNKVKTPNELTSHLAMITITIFSILTIGLFLFLKLVETHSWFSMTFIILFIVGLIICALITSRQPVDTTKYNFKTPFVPVIPFLSIVMNIFLMFELDSSTWVRLVVWLVIGYVIYFMYGIRNSTQSLK